MTIKNAGLALLSLASALTMTPASAKVSAAEAARLGKDLTPVGATTAGNADGSIGPWLGKSFFDESILKETPQSLDTLREAVDKARKADPAEFVALTKAFETMSPQNYPAIRAQLDKVILKLPADIQVRSHSLERQMGGGGKYEKPLFVITKDNLAQYADRLTDGHKAMFAKYADYKMVIYPSLRSGFYPPEVEQATIRNATSAELKTPDDLEGAVLGFPFPIPKTGAEAIWNHKVRFRSSAIRRYNNQAIVKPDGTYKITKLLEDIKFKYCNLRESNPGTKILFYYLSEVLSPPRLAGQLTLVHETSGAGGSGRDAWLYNPGLGRVNRAPDVGYDNPALGTDGEQFNDQIDVFNGALDRYDWKLIGKKELYIPYNSYYMLTPTLQYADIIRPGHINQNLARYELHRVWIVEASLRAGVRHQFKRRRFYIDEDGWAIAVVDCYDNRDQLWKVQEAHLLSFPFVPTVSGIPEVIYDLQSGRTFITTMVNEDKIVDFKIDYKDDYFSPANLSHKSLGK